MNDQQFGYGQQGPADAVHDFAVHQFQIDQTLAAVRTMQPVKVIAVHGDGLSTPMTVDVQPCVNQLDGNNQSVAHGTIFGIPVAMPNAGGSAIILPVAVGDIGPMAVADRDISSVKANKAVANPGSFRKHDLADGVYIPGMYSTTANNQSIQFTSTGVIIKDKNSNIIEMKSGSVKITATVLELTGNVKIDGDLLLAGLVKSDSDSTYAGDITTTGNILAGSGGADSVGLRTHTHTSASPGSQTTSPTAGT